MEFKDLIRQDNVDVFINTKEFADSHNLNGHQCNAIIQQVVINDDLTISDRSDVEYSYGAYGFGAVINVNKDDLRKVPKFGTVWEVDGKLGEVLNVADDEGMLTITWRVNDV